MSRNSKLPRLAHARDGEPGAVAVEFAILLPILVVILFAITTFGLAFSRVETYISAAREGARYAAVHCQPDATTCTQPLVANRVQQAAAGYPITPGPVAVSIPGTTSMDCGQYPGQPVTVSWLQQVNIQIPLLPDFSKTVTIAGVFRCE